MKVLTHNTMKYITNDTNIQIGDYIYNHHDVRFKIIDIEPEGRGFKMEGAGLFLSLLFPPIWQKSLSKYLQ